ncbi:carboxymuconolactone decarboxylase family protein [Nocardioides sp. zg-1308]|uniref:carboxymuconolactone decarboxylase family protein n=1 Tax=Nocardioides sp. zg-1308 TaxID=2736253 RepID=UPI0015575B0C|nr:carboxymuconolactone decarboxylase family protein [Nocardioides sp. zg-1308]NPD04928.1 carboxymuconolactone decarboxylase family protein [Nocardioides sp. zg-1308]
MPSQFRIPRATIDGAYGALMTRVAKRMWGQVPDNAYVLWHNKPVMKAVFGFEQKIGKWTALDPHLKAYAEMASAAVIGCSWCLDFGYFISHTKGLDEAKVREVPRWRESEVFTDLERDVMAYAEAMTVTPPEVTDEMVAALDDRLGHAAVVELTMMVAVENERSRFNSAMGLASQGFSDVCELPLAQAGTIAT